MKKPTVKSLKDKLDKIFSEFVRRKAADWRGYVSCVTCGITKEWNKGMQAGHFLSRRHNNTRFDVFNVHPQCAGCNGPLDGNHVKYRAYMINTFGPEIVDQVYRSANISKQFTIQELQDLIKEYSEQLKSL